MSAPPSDTPRSEPRQADTPQADAPRTVLLTRSAAQGAAFARALAEESAQNGLGEPRVLFAPLQQARTVEPGADHSAALEALASGHYAWVSFTSANTVRACAQLWDDEFARAVHAGGVRVACVGAATARAVHAQLGLDTDFQPQVQSAAGMLAEFEQPVAEAPAVLVLEGSNARPTLREGLKDLGWDSRRCVLYDMVPAEQVAPGELSLSTARALVQGNAVDAAAPETPSPDVLVVTAPSRLHALLDGAPALPPESVPPVVAIGASTASACRALNLRYVQADSPSPQDLARAAVSLIY
ncbi:MULTISPECIES: uroporphyrinogen-III synthase [unclassified Rothia (in: high G+C Gram-positive bacteria)]|uniref:uroporphyrinogen-III synthase n=1 Tax=unclassified Rothia (in: high G+C Gram-positive bacteria) TaxID=2689056 RepID=UPI0008C6CB39|nr:MULTISPECIES: uroporphyrinogen-III synthase [unclassified Rothia (in: high G+C Gram-positive bacteria)]OFJ79980.1 uroporphyrinogen-III synthase [Rothia sp. HMSC069C10]OFQ74506.1 uroporphyrinogen-III synthase [Rothia sp. HMSC068E02]